VREWAGMSDTYGIIYDDGEEEVLPYHVTKTLVLKSMKKTNMVKKPKRPRRTSKNPVVLQAAIEPHTNPKRADAKADLRNSVCPLINKKRVLPNKKQHKQNQGETQSESADDDTVEKELNGPGKKSELKKKEEVRGKFVCILSSGGCGAVFSTLQSFSLHRGRWYFCV